MTFLSGGYTQPTKQAVSQQHAMTSTPDQSQRQEEYSTPGPIALSALQLRNMPSFNRRRASLARTWVRNPTIETDSVNDESSTASDSHITLEIGKSAKRVSPIYVDDFSTLKRCGIGSCTYKATYSRRGDLDATVCSKHRGPSGTLTYAKYAFKHKCHCGARATYRDGECQVPTLCYWHRTGTSMTVYSYERHSLHHKGHFVGSYVVHDQQEELLKGGVEPNPGPPKVKTSNSHPPRNNNNKGWGPKKYQQVNKEVAKVKEAVAVSLAKETADPMLDEEDATSAQMRENAVTLRDYKAQITRNYLKDLAQIHEWALEHKVSDARVQHEIEKMKDSRAREMVARLLADEKNKDTIAEMVYEETLIQRRLQGLTSTAKLENEVTKMAIEVEKTQKDYNEAIYNRMHQEETFDERSEIDTAKLATERITATHLKGRTGYTEATKDKEAVAQYKAADDKLESQALAAKIEKFKMETQAQETHLRTAPVDHANIDLSRGLKYKYKKTKFQYDLRPFLVLVVSFVAFALCADVELGVVPLMLCAAGVAWSSVYVALQVAEPTLRYKSGDKYVYQSREQFVDVPGKPLLPGDLRMENDRRDLIKYQGLVRFFDVTHKYVAPIKLLTYELPFKRYYEKNTVIAVSTGMMQQIMTKRISYCDDENWVRSKLEYNQCNMTNVNIDKEMIYIEHPDTGKHHGFFVFQETIDACWGWVASQKQRTKHVPRPRAVVSPPK